MRSIILSDIEYLRVWKNTHKEFFFYKNEIEKEAQLNWYNQYSLKNNDDMFIIENSNEKIGCIGVRLFQEFADIYNVILGNKAYKGKHIMTSAMGATIALCSLMYKNVPVRVRVLKNNPAITWYQKIGFVPMDNSEDYLLMEYRNNTFRKKYTVKLEIELPNY